MKPPLLERLARCLSSGIRRRTLKVALAVATAVLIAQIFSLIFFRLRPPAQPVENLYVHRPAAVDMNVCLQEGVHGNLKENALLTILFSPKSLGSAVYNSGGQHHLIYAMEAKSRLDRVNFIVVSQHCEVLLMAKSMGLASLRPQSGTDAGDISYNHVFKLASQVSNTPLVGFANSDIIFVDSLTRSLEAVMYWWRENQWPNIFLQGVRTNLDVSDDLMPVSESGKVSNESWSQFESFVVSPSNGKLFLTNTCDYFFFNRNTTVDWLKLPPFLLGGRAFDNWMVAYVNGNDFIESVDLTPTTRAVHVNHGTNLYSSHYSIASKFNGLVFDKNPMQGNCDTRGSNWETVSSGTGAINIRPLHPNRKK